MMIFDEWGVAWHLPISATLLSHLWHSSGGGGGGGGDGDGGGGGEATGLTNKL